MKSQDTRKQNLYAIIFVVILLLLLVAIWYQQFV